MRVRDALRNACLALPQILQIRGGQSTPKVCNITLPLVTRFASVKLTPETPNVSRGATFPRGFRPRHIEAISPWFLASSFSSVRNSNGCLKLHPIGLSLALTLSLTR
jgi:hypothetical protein